MIINIGTDIVSVDRILSVQKKLGDRFAHRILTKQEFILYQARRQSTFFLASRFAAKEALSKALGTGIGAVSFQELETFHNEQGGPEVRLHGKALDIATHQQVTKIHLSLSDEKKYTLAFVILSK